MSWNYAWEIVFGLYTLIVIVAVTTVLSERRDPVRAVSWITVVVLLPVAGLIFFVFFGQNFRKRKIFNRKEIRDLRHIDQFSKRQMKSLAHGAEDESPEILRNMQTIRLLLNNSKALLTKHNSVTVLNNGENTFNAIIPELKAAKQSIHLEYYIFESDNLGQQIAEILIEKVSEGVEVRLLYDDVGSWTLKRKFIKKLRKAGVLVKCFQPVVFPWLTSKVNYRNHRKIIVIDGRIGYTGGLNVADRYIHGTKLGVWRDTHIRIEGQAVRMLQITFMTDWFFATKEQLYHNVEKYLPQEPASKGNIPVQIATSGPDSDWSSIMQAFVTAISRANKHIYISTPYFLPNQPILTALKAASLGGVDVRIMLPERSDSKLVHWASRSYFAEMLEANVKIYLYQKGFNHSKLMCVDGDFTSIGSVNLDERSFDDNFEVTAMIYNKEITSQVEKTFLRDLEDCKRITLHSWNSRKHKDNFKEAVARLFSPLL